MPGPTIGNPTPDWLKPENASVFDPWYVRAARTLAGLGGLTDPNAAVFGMAAPEPGEGGAIDAAVQWLQKQGGRLADLGNALAKSGEPVTRDQIQDVLRGLSVADAPKVAKQIPITPGLGDTSRILTAGEGAGTYPMAPEAAQRVSQIFHIGTALPRRAEWASMLDPEILHAFENDPELAQTFGSVWAGLSNRTDVGENTANAVATWLYRLRHPEQFPLDPQTLRGLGVKMAPSKTPNVNRAFLGEPLEGPKVGPMEDYMRGVASPVDVMTPDVHALYGTGVTRPGPAVAEELPHIRALVSQAEGLKRGALTKDELVGVWQQSLYDVLHQLDPTRPADAVFGDFWEGARAHKGLAFRGSVKDILRSKGLLDYGAMFDQQKLTAALKAGGWSAASIAGLLSTVGNGRDDGSN